MRSASHPERRLSSASPRRGRKPKSTIPRSTGQIKLPEPIHRAIAAQCESAGVHFTDVGAYFFLIGVNQARSQRGEPPLEIPGYLRSAAEAFQDQQPVQEQLDYGEATPRIAS